MDKLNYWFANNILPDDVFRNTEIFFKLDSNELIDYLRNLWIKNVGNNEALNENSFSNRLIKINNNEILVIKVPETIDESQTILVSIVKNGTSYRYFTYTKKINKRSNTINKYFYEFGECKNNNTYERIDQSYDESEEEFIGLINKHISSDSVETAPTKIKFGFKWTPKDFNTVSNKVLDVAHKLVEMKLIFVENDLNEDQFVVIRHLGLCKKNGVIDSIASGLDKHELFNNKFLISPTESIFCECNDRKIENPQAMCTMQSCPIVVAGYLWYTQQNLEER